MKASKRKRFRRPDPTLVAAAIMEPQLPDAIPVPPLALAVFSVLQEAVREKQAVLIAQAAEVAEQVGIPRAEWDAQLWKLDLNTKLFSRVKN